jgi:microcystin degradation protein MlrC
VYARLQDSDAVPGILDASLWVGYVWADEPRSAASVVVTGTDAAAAQREAEKIARRYWDARTAFDFVAPAGSADWCIAQAIALPGNRVVISDSGDNPTAGGVGDVPYFVSRLLAHREFASGQLTAIYASISDAAAVNACYAAGLGHEVSVNVGGKLDLVHGHPLPIRGAVVRLVDDDPVGGNSAVLRVGGVYMILTTRRKPHHFIKDFTALGLDPMAHKIVAVKIGYLEPELRDIARHALLALTPGAVDQDIAKLPYARVVRPIFPLDPEFADPDLTGHLFGT